MIIDCITKVDNIEQNIIDKAWNFANKVVTTTDYSDSQQTDKEKKIKNFFIGKLGEEVVYGVLKDHNIQSFNITGKEGPDYSIYEQKQKRWNCDLYIKLYDKYIGITIRTQASSIAKYFGVNWIIQSIKTGRYDPSQDNPDSLVCLVECDDSYRYYPCIVYPLYRMNELKISDIQGKYSESKRIILKKDLHCCKEQFETKQMMIDTMWK